MKKDEWCYPTWCENFGFALWMAAWTAITLILDGLTGGVTYWLNI